MKYHGFVSDDIDSFGKHRNGCRQCRFKSYLCLRDNIKYPRSSKQETGTAEECSTLHINVQVTHMETRNECGNMPENYGETPTEDRIESRQRLSNYFIEGNLDHQRYQTDPTAGIRKTKSLQNGKPQRDKCYAARDYTNQMTKRMAEYHR